ncbi:MAG: TonB-dependent receptor [Pseudomonadota bacterium]
MCGVRGLGRGPVLALAVLAAIANAQPELEEVEVVGRRDTAALAVPASRFDVLGYEEQVSLNRTPADWLALLPGVSMNGQGGLLQSYSVRGFSRARIRTEFDGVPILTDRRAGTSVSFVPPDLLEQIVVDKAAASTLYGSGAMGGVVSLLPADVDGARVSIDGRSNDEQFALTALAGDSERLAAGISLRRAENAEAADGTELNTTFEQVAGLVRGVVAMDGVSLRYSWLPSISRDVGRSNRRFPDRRISVVPEDDHSVARLELRSSDRWLLRAYHHYQDWTTDTERIGQRRNVTEYRANTIGGLFHASLDTLGGDGAWGMEWLGRHGVDIRDTEYDADGELLVKQSLVEGDEDTFGAFIDQSWDVVGMEVRGGLRIDHIRQAAAGTDTREENRWSATLRLDRRLGASWFLGAEVASAYRFPTLSERFFNGVTPRGEVRGNPALDPETRRSAELALRFEPPGQALAVNLALYQSDLSDYIERFVLEPDVVGHRSIDDAEIHGAEAALELRSGAFAHTLSYQWQEGETDDGEVLADLNPPEWRYVLAWRGAGWDLQSDLSHRSSRDDSGPGELPLGAATLWNLRASVALRSPRWRTQIYINNLLDEGYRSTADELAPLQPGRTVGLRLMWSES